MAFEREKIERDYGWGFQMDMWSPIFTKLLMSSL